MNRDDLAYWILQHARPIELALTLRWLFAIYRRPIDVKGLTFHVDPLSNFGQRLIRSGEHEPRMAHELLNLLGKGDTFVDLGANEGYFSILASRKVGATGRVFAIEMQERLWTVIEANATSNGCDNLRVLRVGIAEHEMTQTISLSPSINSGTTSAVTNWSFSGSRELGRKLRSQFWPKQTVEFQRLDRIWELHELGDVKLLKVDIEGYELFALRSARQILAQRKVKHIILELHPKQLAALDQSPELVSSYMRELGYRESTIVEGEWLLFTAE